jgi:hypothetical protein
MFIIHGYQGLGNVRTLARGQVSSWLNCAERERQGWGREIDNTPASTNVTTC